MYKNKTPYNLAKNILETATTDEVPFISSHPHLHPSTANIKIYLKSFKTKEEYLAIL